MRCSTAATRRSQRAGSWGLTRGQTRGQTPGQTLSGKICQLSRLSPPHVGANLLIGGHFDIAVRDVVMSIAAFVLARELAARDAAAAVAGKRAALA